MKHTDAAAYVLGVLDQAEAYAFEKHLKGCERCGRQVAEFTSVEDALAKADLRYLSPGGGATSVRRPAAFIVRRCGRLSMIAANLVVVILACVIAALMSSHRAGGRYRRVTSDADITSPAPLDDDLDGGSDQRLLPLPLTFK
ncbi:zf-HC2 domain-containing protein [Amycolatopsis pittospori]|uniref:zf-HC2 domain-containing protein n=1 Tax=Amycolatopsis pittospori TaxID=2749434 RepID=UPI002E2A1BCA|nr:zf-HC2 domain-containing protein [Amycolatopsis pittospori]